MTQEIATISLDKIKGTLFQVQQRFQMKNGRRVSYNELAKIAGVSERTISGWMRGENNAPGMSAIMQFLSELPEKQVMEIIEYWKNHKGKSNEENKAESIAQVK